ncbi:Actin protein 10 [Fasciola hepatica]|uniref:Actin protein 10 n=1 Tax=Fasciola hepatica TaxID=6192 RepID=A0A4E0RPN3_FASHE|nr:Actin protein 10 [Fasciola hepatica]
MPGFESLILGEKTAVIFDIGFAYTKCGFAGEAGPRFIFPTEVTLPNGDTKHFMFLRTAQERRKFFIEFFHHLYYKHLLVNPKDRRVVVVDSILSTSGFRGLIADVLYNHFEASDSSKKVNKLTLQIPSALFAPAHLLSLFTLGLSSAVVLDCGFQEAMTIPVYEGYTLLNAWQAGQLGSHAIYKNLEQLLRENATVVNESGDALPLSSCTSGDCLLSTEVLEDIIARTAFISPASRAADWRNWLDAQSDPETANKVESPKVAEDAFYYPLNNLKGSKRLLIPSRIRELSVECLFTGDSDKITLATLLLQSILLSPIDIRR